MTDKHAFISMKEAAALVGITTQCAFAWHWRGILHAEKLEGRVYTTELEIRRAAEIMSNDPGGRKRLGERAAAMTELVSA